MIQIIYIFFPSIVFTCYVKAFLYMIRRIVCCDNQRCRFLCNAIYFCRRFTSIIIYLFTWRLQLDYIISHYIYVSCSDVIIFYVMIYDVTLRCIFAVAPDGEVVSTNIQHACTKYLPLNYNHSKSDI